jgi:hypothetical protein
LEKRFEKLDTNDKYVTAPPLTIELNLLLWVEGRVLLRAVKIRIKEPVHFDFRLKCFLYNGSKTIVPCF